MSKPEFRLERSEKQKQRDLAALKKAKRLEKKQKKSGRKYIKINPRTYVLKSVDHEADNLEGIPPH